MPTFLIRQVVTRAPKSLGYVRPNLIGPISMLRGRPRLDYKRDKAIGKVSPACKPNRDSNTSFGGAPSSILSAASLDLPQLADSEAEAFQTELALGRGPCRNRSKATTMALSQRIHLVLVLYKDVHSSCLICFFDRAAF